MRSIGLDTGPLADFLGQFYGSAQRGNAPFQKGMSLTPEAAKAINAIVQTFVRDEPARYLVFASTLAFAEITRKWGNLAGGRFHPHQLRAFIAAHPPWFVVDPVDESLVEPFLQVPSKVDMGGGQLANIEWADAIHVATVFSRDTEQEKCYMAVEDQRIQRLPQLEGRCL
ncbi:MAG: hypothetical protein JO112_20500 [Planctomycetes bacterium]|nr:hypothetical protein [Planctomycetota bacterium]